MYVEGPPKPADPLVGTWSDPSGGGGRNLLGEGGRLHTEAGRGELDLVAVGTVCVVGGERRQGSGRLLLLVEARGLFAELLVVVQAGPGGDQLADDHVLLEAAQLVDLPGDGCLGEHPGGLLEGGRGEPRGRVESGLDEAQQDGACDGGLATFAERAGVRLLPLELGDDLSRQQVGVAGIVDAHLAHHLADDDLDVLVVDVDALAAVHALHLTDQVVLDILTAAHKEQFLRADRALRDAVAGNNVVAVTDDQLSRRRNGVLVGLLLAGADEDLALGNLGHARVLGADDDLVAVLVGAAEQLGILRNGLRGGHKHGVLRGNGVRGVEDIARGDLDLDGLGLGADDLHLAVRVADQRLALGDACLEELLDTRETLGDVRATGGHTAGMEGAHGQLRARLTDRLGCDDAHRLADLNEAPGGQVAPVAEPADALTRLAGHDAADLDARCVGTEREGASRHLVADLLACDGDRLTLEDDVLGGDPPRDAIHGAVPEERILEVHPDPGRRLAIVDADDDVLGHVHQAAGEVPGVGGAQRRVGQALAGPMGGDEVLEDVEALGEIGLDGQVDDPPRGVGHETAHAGDLADLLCGSTCPRLGHHQDRVEAIEGLHGHLGHVVGGLGPDLDRLQVALVVGDQAAAVLQVDVLDLLLRGGQDARLGARGLDVHGAHGHAGLGRVMEAEALDVVGDLGGALGAVQVVALLDQLAQLTQVHDLVAECDRREVTVSARLAQRQDRVEENTADGGGDQRGPRGGGHGAAEERHVHGHLVAVEVVVERLAHQGMDLDGLALDEHRHESLDAQPVQCRGAVEEHGMVGDDLVEHVPDLRTNTLHHALGALDVLREVLAHQLAHHERLEQLQGHLLGKTALVQLQLRTDDDDRAAAVVDALAEQVLAEAALLALEHVGQRLELAVTCAGDGTAATAVVDQRVHGLLEHALLVAHDDLRGAQLEQSLEPVVAVDDAPVEVIEVAGGEAATVELHHGAQLRRDHREDIEHHPRGCGARLSECLDHAEALDRLLAALTAGGLRLLAQAEPLLGEVDLVEQLAHRSRSDARLEHLAVAVDVLAVLGVREQVAHGQGFERVALAHDVALEGLQLDATGVGRAGAT